jgi:hypothetical protein
MVATVAPAKLLTTHCPAYGVWVFVLSTAGVGESGLGIFSLALVGIAALQLADLCAARLLELHAACRGMLERGGQHYN